MIVFARCCSAATDAMARQRAHAARRVATRTDAVARHAPSWCHRPCSAPRCESRRRSTAVHQRLNAHNPARATIAQRADRIASERQRRRCASSKKRCNTRVKLTLRAPAIAAAVAAVVSQARRRVDATARSCFKTEAFDDVTHCADATSLTPFCRLRPRAMRIHLCMVRRSEEWHTGTAGKASCLAIRHRHAASKRWRAATDRMR
eukprot:scaffold43492_cov23-Tisochrysis_lutea.AAC.4